MHGGTMTPQWRAHRTNTRPSSSLLLPQLLARAGNLPAGLGRVRAAMLQSAVVLDRFPQQVFIDRAENLVGQFQRPDFSAAQILNLYGCHIAMLSSPRAWLPSTDQPWPLRRIHDALSGPSSPW